MINIFLVKNNINFDFCDIYQHNIFTILIMKFIDRQLQIGEGIDKPPSFKITKNKTNDTIIKMVSFVLINKIISIYFIALIQLALAIFTSVDGAGK